jgi:8-oxo-dGTP pyrophosphatase MutT (NUDIX family)
MDADATLMRQIAALPYRTGGGAEDVSILLVTSRETKRWVIPKGNPMRGLAPHAAAAMEAEEEAGVRGAIGATAVGSYRYLKRRKNGTSAMLEVDVFPLAVTEELHSWKEKDERERRWFAASEAAEAVDEADLAELIRSFEASGPPTAHPADVAARTWLVAAGGSAGVALLLYLLTELF